MRWKFNFILLLSVFAGREDINAQDDGSLFKDSFWTFHFQQTDVTQAHPAFKAKYSGTNSLADSAEFGASSITATIFLGKRLWKGAYAFFNPELSGGRGLSYSVGVAGALNGETYRIGDPAPVVSVARAYFQQVIALGDSATEKIEDDINQVSDRIPSKRLTIIAGKFAMADFYDYNSYSHDPRTQFLNWALMDNGAWDYPANIKGYTEGLVVDLVEHGWSLSFSSVAEPVIANHSKMEYVFGKAHSETLEFTRKIKMNSRPGAIRILFSHTASRAPSYQQGLAALKDGDTSLLLVISGNAENHSYGGQKNGVFLNAEQEIADGLGAFARLGWNDGKYVTWAFTEIDQTVSAGLTLNGTRWKRKEDVVGLAGIINGISADHRAFLKAGGYGFIIGDGNLNYGHESILETYYDAKIYKAFWLTFDYQFVLNPAYNKDRKGPVDVFSLRVHIEI